MNSPSDTAPEVEQFLIDGCRRMSPAEKLGARLRARYGSDLQAPELRLRLAALRLDPKFMANVLGWDPAVHGL